MTGRRSTLATTALAGVTVARRGHLHMAISDMAIGVVIPGAASGCR